MGGTNANIPANARLHRSDITELRSSNVLPRWDMLIRGRRRSPLGHVDSEASCWMVLQEKIKTNTPFLWHPHTFRNHPMKASNAEATSPGSGSRKSLETGKEAEGLWPPHAPHGLPLGRTLPGIHTCPPESLPVCLCEPDSLPTVITPRIPLTVILRLFANSSPKDQHHRSLDAPVRQQLMRGATAPARSAGGTKLPSVGLACHAR